MKDCDKKNRRKCHPLMREGREASSPGTTAGLPFGVCLCVSSRYAVLCRARVLPSRSPVGRGFC